MNVQDELNLCWVHMSVGCLEKKSQGKKVLEKKSHEKIQEKCHRPKKLDISIYIYLFAHMLVKVRSLYIVNTVLKMVYSQFS